MSLLRVENLKLYYSTLRGVVRAVDDVSFEVKRGETLGVVGESGCGKTSMANALMRLLPRNVSHYSGKIILDGVNLMELSEEEVRKIRWRKVAIVFQGAMNILNPVLKIGFQVAEPLITHSNIKKEEAYETAREKLGLVGLPAEVFERYPHELSGGMRQRAVIAMALVMNPALLILDEPTSALDVSIQAQIMNLFKRLKRKLGLSMIFITHDIALASDISDRIAVMYAGKLVELGTAEQILLNPRHPYTRRLLAATPRLKEEVKPEFIPGAPPDLASPPSGCRFHPRCPNRLPLCAEKSPPGTIENGRIIRCWLTGRDHEPVD